MVVTYLINNPSPNSFYSYSTDGKTFTRGTSTTLTTWNDVCYNGSVFVAVGSSGTTTRTAAYSTNGMDWTAITTTATGTLVAVCWADTITSFITGNLLGTGTSSGRFVACNHTKICFSNYITSSTISSITPWTTSILIPSISAAYSLISNGGTTSTVVGVGTRNTSVTVTAGSFIIGTQYTITTLGANFTSIGASANTIGIVFTATGVGASTGTVTAGSFIIGTTYTITTLGTTVQAQWVSAGVPSGTTAIVGTIFTATGVGAGTGTATGRGTATTIPCAIFSFSLTTNVNTIPTSLNTITITGYTVSTYTGFSTGYNVIYGNNMFVAVGTGTGTGLCSIIYSSNGIAWTPVANSQGIFTTGYSIVYTPSLGYVACGTTDNTNAVIATSTDGMTWITSYTVPYFSIGYNIRYCPLTTNPGYYVTSLPFISIFNDTNASSLRKQCAVNYGVFTEITWCGDGFFGIYSGIYGNTVYKSYNGINWTLVIDNSKCNAICWNGNTTNPFSPGEFRGYVTLNDTITVDNFNNSLEFVPAISYQEDDTITATIIIDV